MPWPFAVQQSRYLINTPCAKASTNGRTALRDLRLRRRQPSSAVADGGIILSKVLRDPMAMPRQILLYRDFVKAVFTGA